MVYFCPKCWHESKKDFSRCPDCGYNTREFELLSFEDKLIYALNHPVTEFRMNAIRRLGNMESEMALKHFKQIIEKESDIFILLEIVEALKKINSKKSEEILFSLSKHRSLIVSEMAKKALFTGEKDRVEKV